MASQIYFRSLKDIEFDHFAFTKLRHGPLNE